MSKRLGGKAQEPKSSSVIRSSVYSCAATNYPFSRITTNSRKKQITTSSLFCFSFLWILHPINRKKKERGKKAEREHSNRSTFPKKSKKKKQTSKHKGLNCRRLQDLGAKFVREVTPLTIWIPKETGSARESSVQADGLPRETGESQRIK